MPIHPCQLPIEELLSECQFKRTRGSGPGGQHRNKVETAIRVTHQPTGVIGQASEERSQNRNREKAIQRLRLNLALAVRSTDIELDAYPSELWRSRQRGTSLKINAQHDDFATLIAEALDLLMHYEWTPKLVAEQLGLSNSQLIKFLKTETAVIERVNRERERLGLHRLK